jgi:glycosyltransferase involved in cell wall biosynthesis
MPLGHQRGGGELMLVHLIREWAESGVKWHIVFLEPGPLAAELSELGARVTVMEAGRLRHIHRYIATVLRIARWATRNRLDLVVGWMAKGQIYAAPAATLARLPSLWYQLGIPVEPVRLDRVATLLPARGVLVVSDASARAQGAIRPHRPTRTVYPGVELASFDPERLPSPKEVRREVGLPQDARLVGIFGRLQRWKGMHTLIEALPAVLAVHNDTRAVIVGGEHSLELGYLEALEERIAALGLDDKVLLAGFQTDVPRWMRAMDVIVHASDREPFGMVIIEAMALAKPVIATDEGGPSEIVTDGKNGVLVPFEDAAALSNAILRCFDPERASAMGDAARSRAERFSTSRYAHDFTAAMRELVPGLGP